MVQGRFRILSDEERKANQAESNRKYRESEKGKTNKKAYDKIYSQTEKFKIHRKIKDKKYKESEKGKATIYAYNFSRRLKVLRHYSKSLSNSDIPCCRCCRLNEHTDFLAIDHILGKKEMDSIPELTKIGYSSELEHLNK